MDAPVSQVALEIYRVSFGKIASAGRALACQDLLP